MTIRDTRWRFNGSGVAISIYLLRPLLVAVQRDVTGFGELPRHQVIAGISLLLLVYYILRLVIPLPHSPFCH